MARVGRGRPRGPNPYVPGTVREAWDAQGRPRQAPGPKSLCSGYCEGGLGCLGWDAAGPGAQILMLRVL